MLQCQLKLKGTILTKVYPSLSSWTLFHLTTFTYGGVGKGYRIKNIRMKNIPADRLHVSVLQLKNAGMNIDEICSSQHGDRQRHTHTHTHKEQLV